jgi:hypothetical protein
MMMAAGALEILVTGEALDFKADPSKHGLHGDCHFVIRSFTRCILFAYEEKKNASLMQRNFLSIVVRLQIVQKHCNFYLQMWEITD